MNQTMFFIELHCILLKICSLGGKVINFYFGFSTLTSKLLVIPFCLPHTQITLHFYSSCFPFSILFAIHPYLLKLCFLVWSGRNGKGWNSWVAYKRSRVQWNILITNLTTIFPKYLCILYRLRLLKLRTLQIRPYLISASLLLSSPSLFAACHLLSRL